MNDPLLGIHLTNGEDTADLGRILRLDVRHYVALHSYPETIRLLKSAQPDAKIHARGHTPGSQYLPDLDAEVQKALGFVDRHGHLIQDLRWLNEVNLEYPLATGGEYYSWMARFAERVRRRYPGVRLYLPAPSPGIDGWQRFLMDVPGFDGQDCHAYGWPWDIDRTLSFYPTRPVFVSETGRPRATQWDLYALEDVFDRHRVEGACFFIWKWAGFEGDGWNIKDSPLEEALLEMATVRQRLDQLEAQQHLTYEALKLVCQKRIVGEMPHATAFVKAIRPDEANKWEGQA